LGFLEVDSLPGAYLELQRITLPSLGQATLLQYIEVFDNSALPPNSSIVPVQVAYHEKEDQLYVLTQDSFRAPNGNGSVNSWSLRRMNRDGSNMQIVAVLERGSNASESIGEGTQSLTIDQTADHPIIYFLNIDNVVVSFDTTTQQQTVIALPGFSDVKHLLIYNNDLWFYANFNSSNLGQQQTGLSLVCFSLENNTAEIWLELSSSQSSSSISYFTIFHSIYYGFTDDGMQTFTIRKLEGTKICLM
jgi:hypothetical protein